MSLAQILEEVRTFPTSDLESLEHSLRMERLRRAGRVLDAQETRLFSVINEPLPAAETVRALRHKREERTLTDEEQTQLVELENKTEVAWADKLRAVAELADLRGEEFGELYQKLGLTLRTNQ